MGILTYKGDKFYLDGEPYLIISGAMHYFRIPREYWHDRLLKMKECGFNTLETYTAWNLHEPKEGEFDFSGNLDLVAYIEEATALGLNVILRPGPYICAEWENGGLPAWLYAYDGIEFRCNNPIYMEKVKAYLDELLPRVRPYLASRGGKLFMIQVENEYGSYGNDKEYLRAVADIYKSNGMDCLYFTSDGAGYNFMTGGALEEYLNVGNFGKHVKAKIDFMREYRQDQPVMCGEYWCGWFDHWFDTHNIRKPELVLDNVRTFFEEGASFNFYMFHGGTNFGFMNGANHSHSGVYAPTVTSYDYGSPLNEAGDRTPAYYAIRDIIKEYTGSVPELTAKDSEKCAYGKLRLTERASLFSNLEVLSPAPVYATSPKYMEDIGQDYGYTLYRSTLKGPFTSEWSLLIGEVRDRAQIFIDGEPRGVFERWNLPKDQFKAELGVDIERGKTARIDILVENMGRVNFGTKLWDRKGIRDVFLNVQRQFGWEHYALDMRDISGVEYEPIASDEGEICGPVFLRTTLNIEGEPKDTFLRLDNLTKGFVVVNGINIGRYFTTAGPQKTLYVPAPFLKSGENEIVVFESDKANIPEIEFTDTIDLGEDVYFGVD